MQPMTETSLPANTLDSDGLPAGTGAAQRDHRLKRRDYN
jgi:hypothetical protein